MEGGELHLITLCVAPNEQGLYPGGGLASTCGSPGWCSCHRVQVRPALSRPVPLTTALPVVWDHAVLTVI